jgi:glutathione synthase
VIQVLFLTDHRYHCFFDSVYILARELHQYADIQASVASLGDSRNQLVGTEKLVDKLWCVEPTCEFSFENRLNIFEGKAEAKTLDQFHFLIPRVLPIDLLLMKQLARQFNTERIINNPLGVIKTESKLYLTNFPELCPPIYSCYSAEDLFDVISEQPMVLKPEFGYGGINNILCHPKGHFDGKTPISNQELRVILSERVKSDAPYLAMRYLPRYTEGDKRILVVNGKVVGASLRKADGNGWICNISSGGSSQRTELTEQEHVAIERITPKLKQEGVLIYGLDTLVDDEGIRRLSEINTYCVGGFYSMNTVLDLKESIPLAITALREHLFASDKQSILKH